MKDPSIIGALETFRSEDAIKGFSGATLISAKPHKTADVLENVLGLECIGQEEGFLRFKSEGTAWKYD